MLEFSCLYSIRFSFVNSWWQKEIEKKNQCKHLRKTCREWSEMQNKFCLKSCAVKCLSGWIIENLCKAIMETCLKYDELFFFSSLFVILCQVWLDNRRLDLARTHIEKLILDYCPRCAEVHFKECRHIRQFRHELAVEALNNVSIIRPQSITPKVCGMMYTVCTQYSDQTCCH